MKRLLFIIPFAGMVVLLFIRGSFTGAYYSNSATSTNNIFAAISAFPTATLTPTPQGIANHVVISEVQTEGPNPNGSSKEFIELYNPLPTGYDLNGHRLVKRDPNGTETTIYEWLSSTIISSHGFYLWAASDNSYAQTINADASAAAKLSSVQNSVGLRNGPLNTGTLIDALSWHSSNDSLKEGNPFGTNPTSGSIERKALSTSTVSSMTSGVDISKGNGYDTNDNATDFILRPTPQPQNTASPTEVP